MTTDEFRSVLNADPFVPFRMHFGSGKTLDVSNPGLVAINASGRIAFAFKPAGDGLDLIDLLLAERIELLVGKAAPKRRRRSA